MAGCVALFRVLALRYAVVVGLASGDSLVPTILFRSGVDGGGGMSATGATCDFGMRFATSGFHDFSIARRDGKSNGEQN
jgi:hypothetical protein